MFMCDLPPWPRYRPLRIIGQGGFGTVYLCEDTEPTSLMYEQYVAVKAISLNALSDAETLMVMSEVSLLRNIDHPNIIKYYDSFLYEEEQGDDEAAGGAEGGEDGGEVSHVAAPPAAQWLCLVTEYMDGGDLASLMKQYTKVKEAKEEEEEKEEKEGSSLPESRSGSSHSSRPSGQSNTLLTRNDRTPSSHTPQLLEGPFSADMYGWDSASDVGSGLNTAARLTPAPSTGEQRSPPSRTIVGAETPFSVLLKRPRSAERRAQNAKTHARKEKMHQDSLRNGESSAAAAAAGTQKEEKADASTRLSNGVAEENWERRSSQHRRRLASTLRLADHPLAQSAADKTRALTSAAEDKAALDTWISDTSAAEMPATPLGATELAGQPKFTLTEADYQDAAAPSQSLADVEEAGSSQQRAPSSSSSPSCLDAQLPPRPDQLWVESFLITDIAKQCLDALAYLHALGILHRDIKPSNIYLSKQDGTVKIGDFGVSKLLQPSAPFATTFVGTPFYLCPELCMGDPYSYGADVWALGVLLYELYCLKLPFTSDNVLGQIYVITEGTYDTAALRRPHAFAAEQRAVLDDLYGPTFAQSEELLHGLIVDLVESMLIVDPAQRPSAEALLTRVFGGVGVSASSRVGSSAGTSVAPTPLHRPPSAGLIPPNILTDPRGAHDAITRDSNSDPHRRVSCNDGAAVPSTAGKVRAAANTATAAATAIHDERRAATAEVRQKGAVQRLGPAAADQHARWAGSLVQAASFARLQQQQQQQIAPPLSAGNTNSADAAAAAANAAAGAPATVLSSSSPAYAGSPPAHLGDEDSAREPLAIKVRLNMLDILQEMPFEQRERLESCAAEEVAHEEQQRQRRSLAISPMAFSKLSGQLSATPSTSATALMSAAPAAKDSAPTRTAALGSFGEYTQQPMLMMRLPSVSLPTHQLYGTSATAAQSEEGSGEPNGAVPVAAVLQSSSSLLSEEDALDRLIGADTRGELGAFLDEVPWLQNADVFSAIPLSAGSDDVMFVARANYATAPNRPSASASLQGEKSGQTNESRSSLTRADGASDMQRLSNGPAAATDNALPSAVRYAGSLPASSPSIDVVTLPRMTHPPSRQRASITSALRLSDVEQHKVPSQTAGKEATEEQQETQRRISQGATTAHSASVTDTTACSPNHKNGSEGTKGGAQPRRPRATVAAAATAALAAPPPLQPAAPAGEDRDRRGGQARETEDEGKEEEEEREVPAAVRIVATRGGSGSLRSRLSSTEQHRQGSAAGARVRPISASLHDDDELPQAGGADQHHHEQHSNSNSGSGSGMQENTASAGLDARSTARMSRTSAQKLRPSDTGLSLEVRNKREGLEDFPVAPLSAELVGASTSSLHVPASPEKEKTPATAPAIARAGTTQQDVPPPSPQPELPPPPPTPKVRAPGHCEGFTTSELEALLRAKLLAHYRKRQHALRVQRAEQAALEAARARAREKLEAVFATAYNARLTATSPDTLHDTASYHSTHTYDTLLSDDEGGRPLTHTLATMATTTTAAAAAAPATASSTQLLNGSHAESDDGQGGEEVPRRLARMSTMPPKPGTSTQPLPTPPQLHSARTPSPRQLPKRNQHSPSSSLPAAPQKLSSSSPPLPSAAASARQSSPLIHSSRPSPDVLDQTARQAVKEEVVLRALSSARHPTDHHHHPSNKSSTEHPVDAEKLILTTTRENAAAATAAADASEELAAVSAVHESSRPDNTKSDIFASDLLIDTPAVRQLQQAASQAAAVERQKELFRQENHSPLRIPIAPTWRPPHNSQDVPGLWETSSAEGETEVDARGRLGRAAPPHLREELRWRWSCPPSDQENDEENENEDDEVNGRSGSEAESTSTTETTTTTTTTGTSTTGTGTTTSPRSVDSLPSSLTWQESTHDYASAVKAALPSRAPRRRRRTQQQQQQQQEKRQEERRRLKTKGSSMRKRSSKMKLASQVVDHTAQEVRKKKSDSVNESGVTEEEEVEAETAEAYRLQRQSSLLGSPMELRVSDDTPDSFPTHRLPTATPTPDDKLPPGQRRSKSSGDVKTAAKKGEAEAELGDEGNSRASTLTASEGDREQDDDTTTSNTATDTNEDSSGSDEENSGSESEDSSKADDDEEEEDASYAYTVQIDKDTNHRFFDYVCPITVELVGELPASYQIATAAEVLAQLARGTPSLNSTSSPAVATPEANSSSGTIAVAAASLSHDKVPPTPSSIINFSMNTPSPPSQLRSVAAAAPSPRAPSEDAALKDASAATRAATPASSTPPLASQPPPASTDARAQSRKGDDGDSLESSGRSSLFESYSLLMPNTPTPPPPQPLATTLKGAVGGTEGAEDDGDGHTKSVGGETEKGEAKVDDGEALLRSAHSAPASTVALQRTPATSTRATTLPAEATAEVEKKKTAGAQLPTHRADSMMVFGAKVPATARAAMRESNTLAEQQAKKKKKGSADSGAMKAKRSSSTSKKVKKSRRKSSLSETFDGGFEYGLEWRVRVPPPRTSRTTTTDNDVATTTTTTDGDGTALEQYVYLPLSLALRPMRARTRFVGLLWRLWTAIQLADPALRRVLLGADRCSGDEETCTFREAFGDWVATHKALRTAAATKNNGKKNPSVGTAAEEKKSAPKAGTAEKGGDVQLSDETTTTTAAKTAASPASRWSLYFVESRLKAAVELQSDADWAVVRCRVTEMGQLLPFIRLHLVLKGAEFTTPK